MTAHAGGSRTWVACWCGALVVDPVKHAEWHEQQDIIDGGQA